MLSIARSKKPYSKLLNNTKLVRRFPSWLIQEHSSDPEQPAFLPYFCFTILSILFLLSEWLLPWMQDVYSSSLCFCLSVRKPSQGTLSSHFFRTRLLIYCFLRLTTAGQGCRITMDDLVNVLGR